jgi:hypothetical protein
MDQGINDRIPAYGEHAGVSFVRGSGKDSPTWALENCVQFAHEQGPSDPFSCLLNRKQGTKQQKPWSS